MAIISIEYKDVYGNPNTFVGVGKIKEHKAQGEGDKWYLDITEDSGKVLRIFNPTSVHYQKGEHFESTLGSQDAFEEAHGI
jgi:hypothetical protein